MPEYHETDDYTKLYDPEAEREHGPTGELTTVYDQGDSEIRLTTSELEDFESDTDCELDSDVLTREEFDALLEYVRENFGVTEVKH